MRSAFMAVAGVVALTAAAGAARADEVTFWNDRLQEGFRTDFGTGCPCPLARAGAMVQVAVFEAVNSIDRKYRPYKEFLDVPADASKPAAVAAAAHGVMVELFPNLEDDLDDHLAARLALIPDGPAKEAGIAVGQAAAAMMMADRADDGSSTVEPYTFGDQPGDYRPTPPGFNPICNPEWVSVTPFCMPHGTQFRVPGPMGYTNMAQLLASPEYAEQFNEVKAWGARNSPVRTDEQTQIAFFWANDVNGTHKPPGQLFEITKVVSQDRNLTLEENARLFALVGLAMGDAGIVSWDMKYGTDIDLWRPITAIREADTDGNPATEADPNWEPLNEFTPPFPTWASGHATFAGAHAGVMAEFFGTDEITFTIDSEDPYYNQLPEHPPRTFNSFSEAAWENALSRVYLGVHFRVDAVDGNASGLALGRSIGQQFLLPRCTADTDGSGDVGVQDLLDFLILYFRNDARADATGSDGVTVEDIFEYLSSYFSGC